MARSDYQNTDQDIYAVTLVARIFRALMAVVATFNLETRQFDAVNAFANSSIDESIYCKPSEEWFYESESNRSRLDEILLLLQRALYGLKQSSAL